MTRKDAIPFVLSDEAWEIANDMERLGVKEAAEKYGMKTAWHCDYQAIILPGYVVTGDDGSRMYYPKARSEAEAAELFADPSLEWGQEGGTVIVKVTVGRPVLLLDDDGDVDWDIMGDENFAFRIAPKIPPCGDEQGDGKDPHDWASPHSVLGGLPENPGAYSDGGKVIARYVCRFCGTYRKIVLLPGGEDITSYDKPDEYSLGWVTRKVDKRLRETFGSRYQPDKGAIFLWNVDDEDEFESMADEDLSRARYALEGWVSRGLIELRTDYNRNTITVARNLG